MHQANGETFSVGSLDVRNANRICFFTTETAQMRTRLAPSPDLLPLTGVQPSRS